MGSSESARGGWVHVFMLAWIPAPCFGTARLYFTSMVFEYEINNRFAGQRLDAYLAAHVFYHTRSQWQQKIREGAVLLNGKPAKSSTLIPPDGRISYDFRDFKEFPVPTDYSVLYDDEWFFIVDKPGGLPVHTCGKYINNTLIRLLRQKHPEYDLNLVNRLDRETSGVVVLGKNYEACHAMSRQFHEKRVNKTYIAYVFGEIKENVFEVDAPIAGNAAGAVRVRMGVSEKGASAQTDFMVVSRMNGYTKLFCYPVTGRSNQIRVHLAHIGHPIVGDKLYSGNDEDFLGFAGKGNTPEILSRVILPRQALHAHRLAFVHPFKNTHMEITAEEPSDMRTFERNHMSLEKKDGLRDYNGPAAGP